MRNAMIWLLYAAPVFAALCVGGGVLWLHRRLRRRGNGRTLRYPVDRREGRRWK